MPFIILCAVVSFIVQLVILFSLQNCRGKLRHLPLFLLELFPLSGALYYAVQRPSVSYLGWKFGVAMCLWIAGAFLFGAGLAWVVYAIKKRG